MKAEVYQDLEQELEEIVRKLQSSEVSVDDALVLHAKGLEVIAKMEKHLKTAKNTINKIQLRQDKDQA